MNRKAVALETCRCIPGLSALLGVLLSEAARVSLGVWSVWPLVLFAGICRVYMVVTEHWLAADHAWCFPLEDAKLLIENALQKTTEEVLWSPECGFSYCHKNFSAVSVKQLHIITLNLILCTRKKTPKSWRSPWEVLGKRYREYKKKKKAIRFCISDVKMLR